MKTINLSVSVETSNGAVQECPDMEAARMLEDVKMKILSGLTGGAVLDANGNRVGRWHLDVDDDATREFSVPESPARRRVRDLGDPAYHPDKSRD